MRFNVIIAGSRGFNDYDLLCQKCDKFFSQKKPTTILCGEACGADALGRRYAEEHDIEVCSFTAEWSKYGRGAGMKRNREMLERADALVAFWDERSAGTKNMIEISIDRGIPVRVVRYLDDMSLQQRGENGKGIDQ